MDFEEPPFIQRRQHAELLHALNETDSRGVLLLGASGSGKTALLRAIEQELDGQGRAVFFVSLRGLRDPGELGARVVEAVRASRFEQAADRERTIRSSAGAPPLDEAASLLHAAGRRLPSPVLLLDGLDESAYPLRMAAGVEELSLRLDNWKIVAASRPAGFAPIGRFAHLRVIELGGLDEEETQRLLKVYAPGLPDGAVRDVVRSAGGNPLWLRLLADELRRSGSLDAAQDVSLAKMLERLFARAVDVSPERESSARSLSNSRWVWFPVMEGSVEGLNAGHSSPRMVTGFA